MINYEYLDQLIGLNWHADWLAQNHWKELEFSITFYNDCNFNCTNAMVKPINRGM